MLKLRYLRKLIPRDMASACPETEDEEEQEELTEEEEKPKKKSLKDGRFGFLFKEITFGKKKPKEEETQENSDNDVDDIESEDE